MLSKIIKSYLKPNFHAMRFSFSEKKSTFSSETDFEQTPSKLKDPPNNNIPTERKVIQKIPKSNTFFPKTLRPLKKPYIDPDKQIEEWQPIQMKGSLKKILKTIFITAVLAPGLLLAVFIATNFLEDDKNKLPNLTAWPQERPLNPSFAHQEALNRLLNAPKQQASVLCFLDKQFSQTTSPVYCWIDKQRENGFNIVYLDAGKASYKERLKFLRLIQIDEDRVYRKKPFVLIIDNMDAFQNEIELTDAGLFEKKEINRQKKKLKYQFVARVKKLHRNISRCRAIMIFRNQENMKQLQEEEKKKLVYIEKIKTK